MGDQATAAEGAANETTGTEGTAAEAGATTTTAAAPVMEEAPGEPEPMMQVKLSISLAGEPCHAAGSEIPLPRSEAIRAIEAGYATPVDAKKGKVETR